MNFCVAECKEACRGISSTTFTYKIMSFVVIVRVRPWNYNASSMKASTLCFTTAKKKTQVKCQEDREHSDATVQVWGLLVC